MPQPTAEFQPLPEPAPEAPSRRARPIDYQPPEDDVHLLDFVRTLYKRRWTAVTAFLVVLLSVAAYSFTATPIYEATGKLLIETEGPKHRDVSGSDRRRTDHRRLLPDAVRPPAEPVAGPEDSGSARSLGSSRVRQRTGGGGVEGSRRSERGVLVCRSGVQACWHRRAHLGRRDARRSEVVDAFLGRLQIAPVRNSRVINVKFRSSDPRIAADSVNALSHAYIEQNLEFKFLSSKEASDWLADQLEEQRTQVEATEAALQRYREENDAVAVEDRQNVVVQRLADLNGAVTVARTERIGKEARYRQLTVIQDSLADLDTFPDILANTFIQQQKAHLAELERQAAQLSENLGERHPEMLQVRSGIQTANARLQGEIGKVVDSVRNEFEAARARERSMMAELEAQKAEALAMNRTGIEYGVLEREAESNRQIYQSLLQRANETGVAGELRTSNIRIVDEAEVPTGPASPRIGLNLLLALFVGSMFAVGLAFFFEYLDNRIKTPDEIKTHLGLPFLGLIPLISKKESRDGALLLNNGVPANFAEALRTVRTNLMFSSAAEGARSVVVTSTGPGEGKSVVASNVGIGLAQAGQRVLLIDADMRHPQIHERFGQTAEPGLSNLTVGNAKVSEVVRKTTVPGLWILPSGKVPPNPAELLSSQRFQVFLSSLDEHFDWVIIDTPPVLPVADATIVAHVVTGVLFVVGAEMTNRRAADVALEQLTQANARFAGAVLNRVNLVRNSYYYSQYYRREYAKYYQQA